MSEPARKPYEGYKVYKVFHKQMGRWMACLVSPTHRTTISYARYVMATKLGRPLEKWEQVDHINNDRSDDSVGNLQILTQADNLSKSRRHKSYVKRTCPVCLVEFLLEVRQIKGPTSCCSRRCGGIWSHRKKSGVLATKCS